MDDVLLIKNPSQLQIFLDRLEGSVIVLFHDWIYSKPNLYLGEIGAFGYLGIYVSHEVSWVMQTAGLTFTNLRHLRLCCDIRLSITF